MDLSNILAVAGKPDLNELISRTKSGAIVKNLVNGQKFPVFSTSNISPLSEIRMFTTSGEKPLEEVMGSIYKVLEAKPTDFDPKKVESKVLFDLMGKVLPDYDTERVHASDAKKLFSWYNVLLGAGKLEPTADEKTEEHHEAAEPVAVPAPEKPKRKAPAPKNTAPKSTTQAKSAPKRTTTAKKAI